jgi:hypothetical protein
MAVFHSAFLETQYLPPIETFARLWGLNQLHIETQDHWQKRSYRNRAKITGATGEILLSVPIVRRVDPTAGRRKGGSVRISYEEDWIKVHWESLASAYRRSPYFEYYEDDLAPIYHQKYDKLIELNTALMHFFFEALEWEMKILESPVWEDVVPLGAIDLRDAIYAVRPRPDPFYKAPSYHQVFEDRHGFLPNLSMADMLFNCGPKSRQLLEAAIPR